MRVDNYVVVEVAEPDYQKEIVIATQCGKTKGYKWNSGDV